MTHALNNTTSRLSFASSGTFGLGSLDKVALGAGPFTSAVQESLPVGTTITSIPGSTFEHKFSLFHTIFPSAQKEAAKNGKSESECREQILRNLAWDKVKFTNRFALNAFRKAGQKPTFEGLCKIADPDLFLSVIAYQLGYSRETRLRLGFRDINNMPSHWIAKHKKSPSNFPVLRGLYKAS